MSRVFSVPNNIGNDGKDLSVPFLTAPHAATEANVAPMEMSMYCAFPRRLQIRTLLQTTPFHDEFVRVQHQIASSDAFDGVPAMVRTSVVNFSRFDGKPIQLDAYNFVNTLPTHLHSANRPFNGGLFTGRLEYH